MRVQCPIKSPLLGQWCDYSRINLAETLSLHRTVLNGNLDVSSTSLVRSQRLVQYARETPLLHERGVMAKLSLRLRVAAHEVVGSLICGLHPRICHQKPRPLAS